MKYIDTLIATSQNIARQVSEAERLKKPIENLVQEQIKVMEAYHDEFVKQANAMGMERIERDKMEIKLFSYMKMWAQKIGLPTEKYDNAIKAIQSLYYKD